MGEIFYKVGSDDRFIYKMTGSHIVDLKSFDIMVQAGINHGFDLPQIYGLIAKSFRSSKQASVSDVEDWFIKYRSALNQGHPHCFDNVQDFLDFQDEIFSIMETYKLGDKIYLGGSSYTKSFPPDFDMNVFLSKAEYEKLISHCRKNLEYLKQSQRRYNIKQKDIDEIEKAIENSVQTGVINKRCMFRYQVISNKVKINYLLFDLHGSTFRSKLTTTNKAFDFNIRMGDPNDLSLNLPPVIEIKKTP